MYVTLPIESIVMSFDLNDITSSPTIFNDTLDYPYAIEVVDFPTVPEPSTYALILGAVALGFTIRRRK